MTQSPTHTHRSAPYPSPHQPGFRDVHNRSHSAVTPSSGIQPNTPPFVSPHDRRMSTPGGPVSPGLSRPLKTEDIKPDPDHQRQSQSARAPISNTYPPFWQDMGPFTTCLPPESQQMLGPAFDPQDPMTSMLMAGSEQYTSSPYYPWGNMQNSFKLEPSRPSFNGMASTLAPAALDNSDDFSANTAQAGFESNDPTTAPSTGLGFNLSQESINLKRIPSFPTGLTRENSTSGLGSGQITPGEGFWDSFVQDGGWTEEAAAN
jgi:hypothetical protein